MQEKDEAIKSRDQKTELSEDDLLQVTGGGLREQVVLKQTTDISQDTKNNI